MDKDLKSDKKPVIDDFKIAIVKFSLQTQNFLLDFCKWLIYQNVPRRPLRILIFRTGSLGDSICAIPAILNVKENFPEAKIDILTNVGKVGLVGFQQLLQSSDYNEIINYLGVSRSVLFRELKNRKYDLIIQLPQTNSGFYRLLRDLFLFRLIAKSGFGWRKSTSTLFGKTQARYLVFPNEIERLISSVESAGLKRLEPEFPILKPGNADIDIASNQLAKLETGRKKIGFVVGANYVRNRWPVEYFAECARVLGAQFDIILFGSQADNDLVQTLLEIPNVYNLCGKLTPLQSAAAMTGCSLVISNDTGPMHMAYAVGVPVIGLFSGMNQKGQWHAPENGINVNIRNSDIPCEICFGKECFDNNNICMKMIQPELVIGHARQILDQNPTKG